jgi:hypothetical protein
MKKIQITDLSMDELKKILSEVMNECMNTNGSSDSDIIGIDEVCKMTGIRRPLIEKSLFINRLWADGVSCVLSVLRLGPGC